LTAGSERAAKGAVVDQLAEALSDLAWTKIDREVLPALLTQLASAQVSLAARLLEIPEAEPTPSTEAADLLRIDEAARRLNVSKTWLYRRIDRLPFVVRLDRQVRFSAAGLERYLRVRQGRRPPS
jgi:excisionase family DNA binding protein